MTKTLKFKVYEGTRRVNNKQSGFKMATVMGRRHKLAEWTGSGTFHGDVFYSEPYTVTGDWGSGEETKTMSRTETLATVTGTDLNLVELRTQAVFHALQMLELTLAQREEVA